MVAAQLKQRLNNCCYIRIAFNLSKMVDLMMRIILFNTNLSAQQTVNTLSFQHQVLAQPSQTSPLLKLLKSLIDVYNVPVLAGRIVRTWPSE